MLINEEGIIFPLSSLKTVSLGRGINERVTVAGIPDSLDCLPLAWLIVVKQNMDHTFRFTIISQLQVDASSMALLIGAFMAKAEAAQIVPQLGANLQMTLHCWLYRALIFSIAGFIKCLGECPHEAYEQTENAAGCDSST